VLLLAIAASPARAQQATTPMGQQLAQKLGLKSSGVKTLAEDRAFMSWLKPASPAGGPRPTKRASLSVTSEGGSKDLAQTQAPPAPSPTPRSTHRFWDRTNDWWFAGVGAARGLDYASTLNLRRRGVNEVFLTNSIVDNHPLFGGIEAAATGASIGVSYVFHRAGHHRLERWTSIVHFGVATVGAARNYALKTPQRAL
jgi:hypothetical protein